MTGFVSGEQDIITNVTAAGVLGVTMATNTSGREPDTVTINALNGGSS